MNIKRKTIEKDEEYLKQISSEVSFDDKSYLDDIKLLEEFCNNTECFALAAVQIDNTGLVVRPYEIVIKYFDINAQEHTETFEGFESTVLSHELDHLDGILHMDIAEEVLQMNAEERKIFRDTHPYEIISKDCEYERNKSR